MPGRRRPAEFSCHDCLQTCCCYLRAPLDTLSGTSRRQKRFTSAKSRAMLKKRMPLGQVHSRTATALAAVERALAELRRGGIVVLRDDDSAGGLVIAAESCGTRALQRLQGLAQDAPVLVTTRRRAEAIGMEIPPHIAGGMGEINKPITLDLPEGVPVDIILRHLSRPVVSHAPRIAETAIELAKLARLLPAVVLGPLSRDPRNKRRDWAREQDLIYVDAI